MTKLTTQEDAYQHLFSLMAQTADTQTIENLLHALLTEKELSDISNRIRIFSMLSQQKPQREISEKLGVGIATVSRGAKVYQQFDVIDLLQLNTTK